MNKSTGEVQNEYESLIPIQNYPGVRPIQRNRRGPMMRVKRTTSNAAKPRRSSRTTSKSLAYNSQSRGKRLDRFLASQDDKDILTESAYASSSNSVSSASLFDPYAPVNLDELLHSEYESLSLSPQPESIFLIPRCFYKILPTNTNRHVYIFFGGLFLVLSMVILTCLALPNVSNQRLVDSSIVNPSAQTSNGIYEIDIHKVTSKMEAMDPKMGNVTKYSNLENVSSSALKGKLRKDPTLGMDYSEDDMVIHSQQLETGENLHDDYVQQKKKESTSKVLVEITEKQPPPISPLNTTTETITNRGDNDINR
jgi:hypothetical protein